MTTDYEVVIGLEVHAELATKTKLFSSCPNEFGGEPNNHIDPVTLGLPGTLPVLNKKAVELAMRVGLALGSEICPSIFARKNYFYPDMPKDFQISQYDQPINVGGTLELPSGKRVRITRAHLEEDTGKINHIGGGGRIGNAKYCLIDYNRAGIPLLEIVSEPDMSSSEEAREYVNELRALLVAVGACDGKMEEGSLRVDCNVSVKLKGSPELGTRCEIKNVNSLRSLVRAIEYEASRHIGLLESQQEIKQQTRHWDEDMGETIALRSKEGDVDYRYFPEPDLVLLDPEQSWIEEVRANLPMLPSRRRSELKSVLGCDDSLSALFVRRGQDELLIEIAEKGADVELALKLAEQNLAEGIGKLTADNFSLIISMAKSGELSATQVKQVLATAVQSGNPPKAIAEELGFEAMDTGELEDLLDNIIAENPKEWERYGTGEKKLEGFFVGKIMQATKGKADGKVVAELLSQKIDT